MEKKELFTNSEPIGNGKKVYERLSFEIKFLDAKSKKDPAKLQQIMSKILKIAHDLSNNPNGLFSAHDGGSFFIKLFRQTRDAFDLDSIEKSDSYSKTIVQRLRLLADPDEYAQKLLSDPNGKWEESDVIRFANDVCTVADFYAFQNVNKSEAYVRNNLKAVYGQKYSKLSGTKDQSFKRWLSYNKDNYEYTAPNLLVETLPKPSKERLSAVILDLQSKGVSMRSADEFNAIFSELGKDSGSSRYVRDILKSGNLKMVASSDKNDPMYYAPQSIYLVLSWAFYQALTKNPNAAVTDPLAKKVHEAHNAVFEKFPELLPADLHRLSERADMSDEVSDEVVGGKKITREAGKIAEEMVADNKSHLPDLKNLPPEANTVMGSLFGTQSDLQTMKAAIIQSLNGSKSKTDLGDELMKEMDELRSELKALHGIDKVVSLNPNLDEEIKKTSDYYEAFAFALQNAVLLSQFEEELDEISRQKEKDWKSSFSRLGHIYLSLRFRSYLPAEAVSKYKVLLARSEKLYFERATVLGVAPTAKTAPSPFRVNDPDSFYSERSPYEYSPMLGIADSRDGIDESFEIPEAMNKQLNRIEVIRSLATTILHVDDLEEKEKLFADPVMRDLDAVQEEMINYYKGNEYDGSTPFNLDKKLDSRVAFRNFLFGLKDLLTPMWAKKGATLKSDSYYTKFERYVDKKGDVSKLRGFVNDLGRDGSKYKGCYDSLMQVLNGGDNLSMETIKYAGVVVVKLERDYFKDYIAARSLMAKLLQPHMAKSRDNLQTKNEALTRHGYEKAHAKAARDVRNYLGSGGNAERVIAGIRESIKQKNPAISDSELSRLSGSAYTQYYDAIVETQAEVYYKTFLDHTALRKEYFEFFGEADGADKELRKYFVDSVDPDSDFFKLSDEGVANIKTFTAELVINGLGMLAGLGAAAMVVRIGRWTVNLHRFASLAKFISKGVHVERLISASALGAEALVFHDVTAKFHNKDTLMSLLEKGKYKEFSQGLAGEMAFFGAAHGVNWVSSYIKQGTIGRGLMSLAVKNPEMSQAVEQILAAAAKKSPEEALLTLETIISRGVKMQGVKTYQKLPREIAELVEMGTAELSSMRQQYARIIENLPGKGNSPLKKVCGFLLQDLQFDALAMILGSYAKNGVLPEGMGEKMDLTSADTWMEMYTMAAAFRGAFTVVQKGGHWVREKISTIVPEETLPVLKSSEFELKKHLQSKGLLPSLRAKIEGRLTEIQSRIAAIEAELAQPRKLGDVMVPSAMARLMPRWLRQHFYGHYVDKKGNFLGSDGLRDVILGRSPDLSFAEGVALIRTSKRLLLSTNQVLVIASKLENSQRFEFLEACGPKMSKMQVKLFTDSVDAMNISDVPESYRKRFDAPRRGGLSTRPSGAEILADYQSFVLRSSGLMISIRILDILHPLAGGGVDVVDRQTDIPAISSTEFAGLPEAKPDSKVVISGASGVKEWSPAKAKEIFSNNPQADQAYIIKSLEKAGAPKSVLETIEKIFNALSDGVKPFIRVFAEVDGVNTKPLLVINHGAIREAANKEVNKSPEAKLAMAGGDVRGLLTLVSILVVISILKKIGLGPVIDSMTKPLTDYYGKAFAEMFRFGQRPADNRTLVLALTTNAVGLGLLLDIVGKVLGFALPFPLDYVVQGMIYLSTPWALLRTRVGFDFISRRLGRDPDALEGKIGESVLEADFPDLFNGGKGKDFVLEQIVDSVDHKKSPTQHSAFPSALKDAIRQRVAGDFAVLTLFYKQTKEVLSTGFKFETAEAGRKILKDIVNLKSMNMRIRHIQDILAFLRVNPRNDIFVRAYESELDALTKMRNGKKTELMDALGKIVHINDAGSIKAIKLATEFLDVEMTADGFSPTEVASAKDALKSMVELMNMYPNILANFEKIKMMAENLKLLQPAYDRAVAIAGTGKPAPSPSDPISARKSYADAKATVDIYENLKKEHDAATALINTRLSKFRSKFTNLIPTDPAKRKAIIGWTIAGLLLSGVALNKIPSLIDWAKSFFSSSEKSPEEDSDKKPPEPESDESMKSAESDPLYDEEAEMGKYESKLIKMSKDITSTSSKNVPTIEIYRKMKEVFAEGKHGDDFGKAIENVQFEQEVVKRIINGN